MVKIINVIFYIFKYYKYRRMNIISFSLYGSKATYILGMKENIILGKKYFPNWHIRIYHNETVPEKYIKEYTQLGANCIKCKNIGLNKMNWEGMVWRFFPLDDANVEHWISRDTDSRLSKREADIVNQWIQSGKTLHCIRDHRCHYNAIMGGMFGINNKTFHAKYKFKKISDVILELYNAYKERPYNVDQEFLNDKLWNLLKHDVISHISNDGRRIYDSDIEIPRVADFIGKQYRLHETIETIDNNTIEIEKNKSFKIKSMYKDVYFDIENNRLILSKLTNSDSDSQLWKVVENGKIVNVLLNKCLGFVNGIQFPELILTETNSDSWDFITGGFILNKSTNKMIDMKGGIRNNSNNIWLFQTNWTEAQQWEIVFDYKKDTFTTKNSLGRLGNIILSEYFDQIYVIHLNELLDRKKNIIEQVKKYIEDKTKITIIDTINKNTINKDLLIQNELVAYPGNNYCKNIRINDKQEPLPSPNGYKCWCNNRGHNDLINYNGRIACALGHFLVYEDIVKNGYQKCLILEDDFIFSSEINNIFSNIVNDIPDNWELLYFANARKIHQKHKNVNSSFVFCGFNGGMCSDSSCYAINDKAANELFNNIFPLRSGSDGYLCSIVDRRFKLTNTYIYRKAFGLTGLLKSANDYNKIEEYSEDEIEKYNIILKSIVNKYDKNNINDIINKYSLTSCVP
tara:strand:- start:2291 stop:4348 length:2058 start_codon:yes stop_codon:yes gene_type:complete